MEGLKNYEEDLKKLVELAKINSSEGWKVIDAELGNYANEEVFINWAKENLAEKDSGLRDLSASILEISDYNLNSTDILNLKNLMEEVDSNPYPSFRAACALAKRGENNEVKGIIKEVKNKLQEFIEDEGVSEIAKNYIEKLKIESNH